MNEALLDNTPLWLSGDGPEAPVVVASLCSLMRNLVDFPFPARCSEGDLQSVEACVAGVLERTRLLDTGEYCSLCGWAQEERARLLGERQLVTFQQVKRQASAPKQASAGPKTIWNRSPAGTTRVEGPRGVYVADDQSMSIMVNGPDHLCGRALTSGLQIEEAWARLNLVDDTLAGVLKFAFDERYGYLTSNLAHLGSGLKGGVILHLPALTMTDRMDQVVDLAKQRRQNLHGLRPTLASRMWPRENDASQGSGEGTSLVGLVSEALYTDLAGTLFGSVEQAEGDLYLISNISTLGLSEEEIVFHLRHLAEEIVAMERKAREDLESKDRVHLEDRVDRALGLARQVRVLEFSESLALLSSIRLGVAAGLVTSCTIRGLNELLIASQDVHVKMNVGRDCDELTLNTKRADLFRARFSQN